VNDPWADAPPPITAHQVSRIVSIVATYTAADAEELITTLSRRAPCGSCKRIGTHSTTCPTQGDRS